MFWQIFFKDDRERPTSEVGTSTLTMGGGHRDGSDDSEIDSEIDDDGDEDDDATQPSQAKRRKCDCHTVLAVHVEAFHAMTLTGSSLKKNGRIERKSLGKSTGT